MKNARKIISLFLSIVMLFATLPIAVFAEGSEDEPNWEQYRADLFVDNRISAAGPDLQHKMKEIIDFHANNYNSPSRIWYDLLTSDPSFMNSMKAWKVYTFDLSDAPQNALDEYDRNLNLVMFLITSSMTSEETLEAEVLNYGILSGEIAQSISETMGLVNTAQMPVEMLKDEKFVSLMDEYFSTYNRFGALGDVADVATDIFDNVSTINDFANRLSLYLHTAKVQDNVISVLKKLRDNCSDDNSALKKALTNACASCESAFQQNMTIMKETLAQGGEVFFDTGITLAVDAIMEKVSLANPWVGACIKAVEVGRDLGKIIGDFLGATSDICEQFYYIEAITTIERLMEQTVGDLESDYRNDSSEKNAQAYIASIDMMFSLHELSLDYSWNFVEAAFATGLINKIRGADTAEEFQVMLDDWRSAMQRNKKFIDNGWQLAASEDYPQFFKDKDEEVLLSQIIWEKEISLSGVDAYVGEIINIAYTLVPGNTTQTDITIESSNPSVAKIESNQIIALAAGSADITIRSVDNPDIFVTETITIGEHSAETVESLDLAFVIDTTGSMSDDIAEVRQNMRDYIALLETKNIDYRIAIVDYRDFADRTHDAEDYPYSVQLDFTNDSDAIQNSIDSLTLGYGGDNEETVFSALIDGARELSWGKDTGKSIIVMGDAAPLDPEPYTGYTLASVAQALNGVSVVSGYEDGDSSALPLMSLLSPFVLQASAAEYDEDTTQPSAIEPIIPGERIVTYTIATSTDSEKSFSELSEETGGKSFTANESYEISDIIDSIIVDIPDTVLHEHQMVETVINPTCTADGMRIRNCELCNYKETEVIPAALNGEHVYSDEWTVGCEPTCDRTGWKAHNCQHCYEHTDFVVLEEKHQYEEISLTQPTCETAGLSIKECSVCHETIEEAIVPLGHQQSEWVVKTPAAFGVAGEEVIYCLNCGDVLQTREIAPLTVLAGDVDGDGKVTSSDARLALRAAVKLEVLEEAQTEAADVDGDGQVTTADARKILRAAVGLESLSEEED